MGDLKLNTVSVGATKIDEFSVKAKKQGLSEETMDQTAVYKVLHNFLLCLYPFYWQFFPNS